MNKANCRLKILYILYCHEWIQIVDGSIKLMKLIFHRPNSPYGSERACIYELEDMGDMLVLKDEHIV